MSFFSITPPRLEPNLPRIAAIISMLEGESRLPVRHTRWDAPSTRVGRAPVGLELVHLNPSRFPVQGQNRDVAILCSHRISHNDLGCSSPDWCGCWRGFLPNYRRRTLVLHFILGEVQRHAAIALQRGYSPQSLCPNRRSHHCDCHADKGCKLRHTLHLKLPKGQIATPWRHRSSQSQNHATAARLWSTRCRWPAGYCSTSH